jgi:hypothetical protein
MSYLADDRDFGGGDPHLALRPRPTAEAETARLTERAREDLAALAHPVAACVRPLIHGSGRHVFDVVIVGAAQGGLTIGRALKREGGPECIITGPQPPRLRGPMGDLRPHGGAAHAKDRGRQ